MLKITRTKEKLKVIIATDGEQGFFARGKEIAKLADAGKPIPPRCIINFDSLEEMLAIFERKESS